jgi:predicted MFS family arabinose efflux permease
VIGSQDSTGAEERRPSGYAWYVVIMLMLVYTLSFIDRKLPFILVEAIREDLHLSDTQIGLLTGLMFFVIYCLAAIPLGALADRGSRKHIIAVCMVFWSTLTAIGGLSQGFWQLALSRTGVAIGEAGCTPASHSMIADYFPPRFRGRAIGLYFVGAELGIFLGLGLGGWISDLSSWRVAMFLCGAPGAVLALLLLTTVREPARRPQVGAATASGERPTIAEGIKAVLSHPTILHLFAAGVLFTFTLGAVSAFGPAFVMRTYHLSAARTGVTYGLLLGTAGMVGVAVGGVVGDHIRRTDPPKALMWIAAAFLVAAPCMAMALFVQNYPVFLALLFIFQAAVAAYAGPSFATLQSLVGPRMHGVASALYVFSLSGLGASLGPLLAGLVSDAMKRSHVATPLRWSLIIMVFPLVLAGVHYIFAARALRRLGLPAPDAPLSPAAA